MPLNVLVTGYRMELDSVPRQAAAERGGGLQHPGFSCPTAGGPQTGSLFGCPLLAREKGGHLDATGLSGILLLRNQYKPRLNNLEREVGDDHRTPALGKNQRPTLKIKGWVEVSGSAGCGDRDARAG